MAEKKKTNRNERRKAANAGDGGRDFIVVGLGASAGGVKALREFFATMPPASGMAFVVVLHLSPAHESNLTEILQTQTTIPVVKATETVRVEPDHVYVIPPNHRLEMSDGRLRPIVGKRAEGDPATIDHFFRTLAASFGPNAVAVVLSGTGSDGTLGLKRVKEANGFAIVQEPDDAEFDAMPRHAIATNLVDWVLPVRAMPEKLITFRESSERLHLTGGDDRRVAAEINAEESLREILTLLRVRTGHDFTNYKQPTLIRRIARQLQIHDLEDIPSYLDFLREHPDEIAALQRNLLINVTNFFRDKEAFEALEREVVPQLFAGKATGDTLRVWSAGCASGEEAYSLAILLCEYAERLADPPKIQIFATDVDDEAINDARANSFLPTIEADVSPERLRRYFYKEAGRYRVKKELREMLLFAPHNILRDPPFSKLDLVSCRNLLIYLNRDMQRRVMDIFHFALRHQGFLFLGGSETAETVPELFAPVDKKHRLYVRRGLYHGAYATPAPQLPVAGRWQAPLAAKRPAPDVARQSPAELHYSLLERFAPPSVLVDQDYEVQHMSESVGRFMNLKGGEPTTNLLKLVHPDLLPDLRAALYAAQGGQGTAGFAGIRVDLTEGARLVDLRVYAVTSEGEGRGYLLVVFEEKNDAPPAAIGETGDAAGKSPAAPPADRALRALTGRLEQELANIKQQLRGTIEQHEVSIEELKASNEESQAINEELRSATEELETSKEELQSVNEELTTVNYELKDKIEEVRKTNADLQNLMSATDIATIFLDREMRIKRFTPPAQELFNVIAGDIGRPLEHLTNNLAYERLAEDARETLREVKKVEREVSDRAGRRFLARLLPYRTHDDRIDGVVLNFIDISERRAAEEGLRASEEKYRTLFDSMDEGYCIIEMLYDAEGRPHDWRFLEVNPAFEKNNGLADATGRTIRELTPGIEPKWFDIYGRVAATGEPLRFEENSVALGRWFNLYAFRVGAPEERRVAVLFTDISERKRREANLAFLADISERFSLSPETSQVVQMFGEKIGEHFDASVCAFVEVDQARGEAFIFEEWRREPSVSLVGRYRLDDYLTREFHDSMAAGRAVVVADAARDPRVVAKEKFAALAIGSFINVPLIRDGEWRYSLGVYKEKPYAWSDEEVALLVETAGRIWNRFERALAEAELRASEEHLAAVFAGAEVGLSEVSADGRFRRVNDALCRILGRSRAELLALSVTDVTHADDVAASSDALERLLANGAPVSLDKRYLHRDGRVVWANSSLSLLRQDEQGPPSILAVTADITERKLSEEAARESETRLRVAVEAAEMATWDWNLLTDEVLWNERHFTLLAMKPRPGTVAAEEFLRRVYGDDRPRLVKELRRAIGTGTPYEAEFRVVTDAGDVRWMNGYGQIVRREEGRATRMCGVMLDVTERKRTEERLRESEERMRLLIESAADYAIFTMATDGTIETWNTGAENTFGWPEAEAVGRGSEIVFTPEDRAAGVPAAELRTAAATGKAADERWHVRRDGSRFYVSGVTTPLYENGRLTGFVKIARDLTERQHYEQMLREADRRKDEFLATLAHELRNPLAPVRSGIEVMRRSLDDRATIEQTLGIVERQTDHVVHLVEDLLDISRISQGKIKLRLETVELRKAIELALETARGFVEKYEHRLEIALPDAPVYVEGDLTRLSQIFLNLLNNAVKYTKPRGRLKIALDLDGETAVVRVRDSGIGIAPEMLPRIFEMFGQVVIDETQPQTGLGIGLSLVKMLTEMHGGEVEARSEGAGRGSEFVVRLPVVKAPPARPAETENRTCRILAVDDNPDAVRMLELLLRLEGHEVVTALDGAAALRQVEETAPEAVLLDIGLPQMNGYEVARRLREKHPELFLIAISGWGQEEDRQRSREAGFDHHLVKPVSFEELQRLLNEKLKC